MRSVQIFASEPDLLKGVAPAVQERLRHVRVPLLEVPTGAWHPDDHESDVCAMLIVDGAIARQTLVPGERSIEILGPGDVLVPAASDLPTSVPTDVAWEALQPSELAAFRSSLLHGLGAAAPFLITIASRVSERAHRGSVQMAIGGVHPIALRLKLLLWHLADRWGRRHAGGVTLPVRLTQRTLAALASTERSTICRALIELELDGVLERLPGKHVRLLGGPPGDRMLELAAERGVGDPYCWNPPPSPGH